MRKAVVAVLLPCRELPFIREWCRHHLEQGWDVFLYDNTGSVGSDRWTSRFYRCDRDLGSVEHDDVENVAAGGFGPASVAEPFDADFSRLLRERVRGLPVTVVSWQPRGVDGHVVHGQVEAYVDFIVRKRDEYDWAGFIDVDEFLTTGQGRVWDELLSAADHAAATRILLSGELFESRRDEAGRPLQIETLRSLGVQFQRKKNLVRLSAVVRADIHWGWTMMSSGYATPDERQYYFRHYRGGKEPEIRLTITENMALGSVDESIAVPATETKQPIVSA